MRKIKTSLEQKINCTWNNQNDGGQTTDDQLQTNHQNRLLFLHAAPPSVYKSSCPLIVKEKSQLWGKSLPSAP